jgi:hypothetical protein
MLNTISDVTVAAVAGFGPGAILPSGGGTSRPAGSTAVVFARPRATWAADAFGQHRSAAGQIAAQPCTSKQYPNTTRIAAASGGASGPHPAREPV